MVVPVEVPKEERGTMNRKPASTFKKETGDVQQKKGSKKKQNVKEEVREERKMKGLTPYQGNRRACGMFQCYGCNKYWFSANSWADCYQKCKGCNKKVYPYRQFPPERSEEPRRKTPPHPQHMCQKCKQLGGRCFDRNEDFPRDGDDYYEREE